MQNIMLVLSSVMTFEQILEKLNEAILQYNIAPGDEKKHSVAFYAAMILSKETVERHGLDKSCQDLEEVGRIKERLNTKEN